MPVIGRPDGTSGRKWNVFRARSPKCVECGMLLRDFAQLRFDGSGVVRCKNPDPRSRSARSGCCNQPLLIVTKLQVSIVVALQPDEYARYREAEQINAADALEDLGVIPSLHGET